MKTFALAVLCFFLLVCFVRADSIYTWTDEGGVIHLSDHPPVKTKEKVERYRYEKTPETSSVQPGQKSGVQGAMAEDKGVAEDDGKRQKRMTEIEKARTDYEEAKSHEEEYQRNFRKWYGYGTKRQEWREKLEDIEIKRQRLEELERNP